MYLIKLYLPHDILYKGVSYHDSDNHYVWKVILAFKCLNVNNWYQAGYGSTSEKNFYDFSNVDLMNYMRNSETLQL